MPYRYPRPSKHQLVVKRGLSGLGLFSQSPIKKDDFVIEYYGPILSNAAAEKAGGKYLFALDDHRTIDGSHRQNIARYLNHSCQPNCEVEQDGRRLFVYAITDIPAGTELTYHYGSEYFDGYITPKGCRCGHH